MLLDNHFGPDPRVAFELELLEQAGIATRILAWDRRSMRETSDPEVTRADIVRIEVPAPSGGGWRSFLAMMKFGVRVWRRRQLLLGSAHPLVVHDIYLLPLGWALARRLGRPFIYDAHEEWARMEAGRYPNWALRVVTTVENRLAKGAIRVVVPGASRAARWDGVLEQPPIVLPNLVRSDRPNAGTRSVEWDLLYVGTVSEGRRPDLLVELARLRPELRIGVAGRGRSVDYVARAAHELPNLSYLGWRSDAEELLASTTALYYGLDPEHPYSEVACPNTLYQALIHRKPLIFFCAGEPAQLAGQFKIGIRCEASVGSLSAALDHALATSDWEFDAAWQTVWDRAQTEQFVKTVRAAAR